MESVVIIRGRIISPTQIVLDEALPGDTTDVEVMARSKPPVDAPRGRSLLDVLATLPPGKFTKAELDAQIAAEDEAWGGSSLRLFLDANILIYLVEGDASVQIVVRDALARIVTSDPHLVSLLSRIECCVAPLKRNDYKAVQRFHSLLGDPSLSVVPISETVVDIAARLRADYGFKTPDAIQLASALEAGADLFVTADQALRRCREISVELITLP